MKRASIAIAVAMCLVGAALPSAEASYIAIRKIVPKKVQKRAKPAKPQKRLVPPGPVDRNSLGFGSSAKEVARLLGKPDRVAKIARKEIWYYGLSAVTLGSGRVIGWSTYDKPLPVNIGAAKPDAPQVGVGSTMGQLVAAKGTPNTVAVDGNMQLWFYGTMNYTLREGRVVPNQVVKQLIISDPAADAAAKKAAPQGRSSGAKPQAGCYCPL